MKYQTSLMIIAFVVLLFTGCSKHSADAIATKRKSFQSEPSPRQMEVAQRMVNSFAQVKTRPLSLEDFSKAVRDRAGTNLDTLSENEREKLFSCIHRYYASYSSGKFDDFKSFRLHPPFILRKDVASYFQKIAAAKGMDLKSDEDILHFGWDYKNGTNTIGQVDEESIALSIIKRSDLGPELRLPSIASKWPEQAVATCWEGVILYQPTASDLLKKEGALRFFTLNLFVRFSPMTDGPASPLVLVGYWDPDREDWMPYVLCSMLHVGSYDTMF